MGLSYKRIFLISDPLISGLLNTQGIGNVDGKSGTVSYNRFSLLSDPLICELDCIADESTRDAQVVLEGL